MIRLARHSAPDQTDPRPIWRDGYVLTLHLQDDDVAAIDSVVDELIRRYDSVESTEFQAESRLYADELPRRVRRALHEYRSTEKSGIMVVSGLPVDDTTLGRTPAERGPSRSPRRCARTSPST